MCRRAQYSSIMLIAGIASLILAAPPGWAAGKKSFDQLIERFRGELGIGPVDRANARSALEMFVEGRETFRFDTFGDEVFWGDTLRLHEAIMGERLGGVGPGLAPNAALDLGLKVDRTIWFKLSTPDRSTSTTRRQRWHSWNSTGWWA